MAPPPVFDAQLAQTEQQWEAITGRNAAWLAEKGVKESHVNRCVSLMTCGEKQKFASLIKCTDRPMTRMWRSLNRPCGKPEKDDANVQSMLELWWLWFTEVNEISRGDVNFARFSAKPRAGGTYVWNASTNGVVLASNPFPEDTQWRAIWTADAVLASKLSTLVPASLGEAPDYTFSKYVSVPFVSIGTPKLKSVVITKRPGEVQANPKWWGLGKFGTRRARTMHRAVRTLNKWLNAGGCGSTGGPQTVLAISQGNPDTTAWFVARERKWKEIRNFTTVRSVYDYAVEQRKKKVLLAVWMPFRIRDGTMIWKMDNFVSLTRVMGDDSNLQCAPEGRATTFAVFCPDMECQ